MNDWDERKLIKDLKAGCEKAFELCYRRYAPSIYTAIVHICGDRQYANELLQDTFMDVFQHIGGYEYRHSFNAWIKRIAFNNTINFIKRNNRLVFDEKLSQTEDQISFDLSQQLDDKQLLERIMTKVSEKERLVLWLFVVEQYSHDEIAQLLDKSPSFSKSIVSRCLKKLQATSEVKSYACL